MYVPVRAILFIRYQYRGIFKLNQENCFTSSKTQLKGPKALFYEIKSARKIDKKQRFCVWLKQQFQEESYLQNEVQKDYPLASLTAQSHFTFPTKRGTALIFRGNCLRKATRYLHCPFAPICTVSDHPKQPTCIYVGTQILSISLSPSSSLH